MSFAKEVKSAMHGHEHNIPRRPGISVVRPKLHEDNPKNRELFNRWVRLHMRDILSLPEDKDLGNARKVLRYTRKVGAGGEEYFHTIMLDDIRLPATEAFQKISHRLDLENTRELRSDEEPVFRAGDKKMGDEPMAQSIFKPAVGLFEEMRNVDLDRAQDMCGSYQDLPMEPNKLEEATSYKLITLTIVARGLASTPSRNVCMMHASLVSFLGTATQKKLCTGLYSRNAGVQPQGIPKIEDEEHGGGDWLALVLIPGNAEERLMQAGLPGVEGQVDEWCKRVMLEGSLEGVEIKTAVWTGDIFMS